MKQSIKSLDQTDIEFLGSKKPVIKTNKKSFDVELPSPFSYLPIYYLCWSGESKK